MNKIRINTFLFLCLILMGGGILFSQTAVSYAASLKISYLGKTRSYRSTLINTSVNNKSVTARKTKGLILNKTKMVSYVDVFKNGCGVTCTYLSSSKKITMKQNDVTIQMWLGKKTAIVNGVKKKMAVAPVKVKYIKAKKSVILVPAEFVSTNLKYKYSWSKSSAKINLTSPLKINYSGRDVYYNGIKGNIKYNNKDYKLTTMPALSIGGVTFIPAQEVFEKRMKLDYKYDSSKKTITIQDLETKKIIIFTVDSKKAMIDGNAVTLSSAPKLIKRYDTNKTEVCVPADFAVKSLGYYYKWDKIKSVSVIHKSNYFHWDERNGKYSISKLSDGTDEEYKNAVVLMNANYDPEKEAVVININGISNDIMKLITVERSGDTLLVTIPATIYDLLQDKYSDFGDILSSLTVEQKENTTVLTLKSFVKGHALDYAYSLNDNTFTLRVMDEYVGAYSLKLEKPAGVTFDMVSNIDYYNSKKFAIIIEGNHLAFYKANPVAISKNTIKSIDLSLNSSGNTVITVTTTKLQGFKIFNKSSSFVVSVDNPRNIYNKIVVLDAGHGGTDPGAVGNKTKEKDLNFKMIVTLMKPYFSSNAPDIKAYWTRTTDTFVTLSNRAAYAKKMGADIFISLHMNAWTKSSINGTEVYYSASNNKTSFSGLTSKKMASLFLKRLISAMGTTSRGVSSQRYTVVHKNTVPAVLLELGFITGSSDFKKISNTNYQKKATKTIYNTINEIFKTYPTKR